jgi:hypothetical protein
MADRPYRGYVIGVCREPRHSAPTEQRLYQLAEKYICNYCYRVVEAEIAHILFPPENRNADLPFHPSDFVSRRNR